MMTARTASEWNEGRARTQSLRTMTSEAQPTARGTWTATWDALAWDSSSFCGRVRTRVASGACGSRVRTRVAPGCERYRLGS